VSRSTGLPTHSSPTRARMRARLAPELQHHHRRPQRTHRDRPRPNASDLEAIRLRPMVGLNGCRSSSGGPATAIRGCRDGGAPGKSARWQCPQQRATTLRSVGLSTKFSITVLRPVWLRSAFSLLASCPGAFNSIDRDSSRIFQCDRQQLSALQKSYGSLDCGL
jgi:hypothetical protein